MDNINLTERPLDILKHFIFNNNEFKINILWENGEPLFRALDVGNILEMKKIRNRLLEFDEDEKVTRSMGTLGGTQETLMLTELGLYRLLFTSRKPVAKPFQKWVAKVIRDIQRNGKYEVNNLKKELEKAKAQEIESIMKATHETLLNVYNMKHVVYFGKIRELDGKILVKIGSTKNIRKTFISRHPKDYGNIMLFRAFECKTNADFEQFLLHHNYIRQFLYKTPVKIGGGNSIEVILVSEEELEKVLCIATRNIRKYPNAVPDIDDRLSNLEKKIDNFTGLIAKTMDMEHNNSSEESEEVEVSESDLLAISLQKTTPPVATKLKATPPVATKLKAAPPAATKPKVSTRKKGTGVGICSDCDEKISKRATKCINCYEPKKKFKITKDELHNMVWIEKLPYLQIGEKYGVSDNTIRKRSKLLGVAIRKGWVVQ